MNIGFDAKRLYNNFTGLGNYSRTLLHSLSQSFPHETFYLYTPKINHRQKTEVFLNNPSFKSILPSGFSPLWRSRGIVKQLKKDGINIFHGLSNEIPHGLAENKIKSVVTIHDLIFKIYPSTYSFIDRKIYDYKFGHACVNADKIIAISESTKKDIIHYYNIPEEKIKVIYQACDPVFYEETKAEHTASIVKEYNLPKDYLLYVGSVIERKNLKTIINSYDHLPKDLRIPLVVIGNGREYKKEVQQLIADKNLSQYVIWVEHVKNNKHLQAIYQHAQMLIYPSIYEGFGLPIAEALLSKTPVITCNVSSLPEAGGPNSYYLNKSDDTKAMAIGIEKILTDTTLREKMKTEGYVYARNKFDAKEISKGIFNLCKNIL
ncbi:MAG: glycosyltransferase family 4 protein [Cytophagaceae bacterium]|nr:glycosyltransferase family 4 protein [Cytophagaceae bacterium]